MLRLFGPWIAPRYAYHAPLTKFVCSFLSHLPIFSMKTGPMDAPRVHAMGRRTVRTPSVRHWSVTC